MIVVSKLGKPKHLRHVIHKDHRGSLSEVLSKKKIKFNFNRSITVTSKKKCYKRFTFSKKIRST